MRSVGMLLTACFDAKARNLIKHSVVPLVYSYTIAVARMCNHCMMFASLWRTLNVLHMCLYLRITTSIQEAVKAKHKQIFSLKQDTSRRRVLRNRLLGSYKQNAKAAAAGISFEKLAAVLCA
jgi:hypothetical protein